MKTEPFQIAFIGGGINSAIGEVHKAASQMDGHFELVAGAFSTHAETNRKTDTWNAALFSLADENGLHYVDISTMLKANDGTLSASYTDTEVFYQTVYDQILTHVAD